MSLTAPEMLLLPGTLCDERLFAPLLARLPGCRATVLGMTGAASASTLAERLLAAAPPRFALLGFSLGAIVAVEIALLARDRVAGLCLIAPNPRPVPTEDHGGRRLAVARAAAHAMGAHVRHELWPRYVAAGSRNDQVMADTVAAMADNLSHAYADQTEVALSRDDRRGRLPSLTMPSLVLCGAEDTVAPPSFGREVAALLPDAALAIVADAGHFMLLERPDTVATAIAAWLARLPAATDTTHPLEEHV